jgi:hypothetical protein
LFGAAGTAEIERQRGATVGIEVRVESAVGMQARDGEVIVVRTLVGIAAQYDITGLVDGNTGGDIILAGAAGQVEADADLAGTLNAVSREPSVFRRTTAKSFPLAVASADPATRILPSAWIARP